MGVLIKYNNKILKYNTKALALPGSGPTPIILPANTIRCKFTIGREPDMGDSRTLVDADENIWDIYKSGTDWRDLFRNYTGLEEVIAANTTGVTVMDYMFCNCTHLTSVHLFDTSSVTDMAYMFYGCSNLTSVPLFDTSSVTRMSSMFYDCTSLTTVPLFDTSSATNMYSMFRGCSRLTSVPLFDTSLVTNMTQTFSYCYAVESGALALYQQASTQATPPTYHDDTFTNCGSRTVTGAAELSQIPSSWGGTGA